MKEKRFPTILGIIFLLIILAFGVFLSTRRTSLSSRASTSCVPINPQITNLTYASFDFSFTTSTSCSATLSLNGKIYQDSSTVLTTHYFKVTNLQPQTEYQFSLISGSTTYVKPEYELTTTTKPSSPIPASSLAWGKILSSNNEPVSGAIVYLTIPGSQALSAFSNQDGHWNISFATSFNDSKTDWFIPPTDVEEDIIVYSPDGQLTQLSNQTSRNDPVPDIIIGQNNSFSASQPFTGVIPTTSTSSTLSSIDISSPSEGESISSLRPDIFGNGPSGQTLQISLDGNSFTTVPGVNNIWHWSPSTALTLGNHRLSLSYQGKIITRNFTVKQDNNLAFSATPSASLVTPTLPIATLAPTIFIPTPSPLPTTIVRTAKPSTTSGLYRSGEVFPTLVLVLLSMALFSVSLYYYRK